MHGFKKWFVLTVTNFTLMLASFISNLDHAAVIDKSRTENTSSSKGPAIWVANPNRYSKTTDIKLNVGLQVPILEYHQADYIPGNSLGLRSEQFLKEAQWLSDHGYHTINFGQLYAAMYHGYQLPKKPILITFDDGYESVYRNIFPILKKFNQQATVFMISNYVGLHGKWPMLTKDELRIMENSGLVDVESHSATHSDLATASGREAHREIIQSSHDLEKITGHPIRFFCYPSGRYNSTTVKVLKENGYLLATVQGHQPASLTQGPYALHRIPVYQTTSLENFAEYLSHEGEKP
ncbi:polysaccharide deacetylase family protein [Alicyclobacillus fastidiosus]|uniref:Polysaccharide deacetylase family protein n=1 Tax=Alicyclobacillus fastidiosus TaxID=392011 RepID=A0ABY6ZFK3_9BACL|nr:polysaccharide deacetylase family protein [Alicyclobacillus fastidiosus]WAH41515.1 polysaccharide deacetylase family protein [Alicyclobacillus fastidiosus]GMA63165.1 xylanase [Alicyclobacillus fastidiosus]